MKRIKTKKKEEPAGGTEMYDEEILDSIEYDMGPEVKLSIFRNPKVKFFIVFLIKTVETFAASIIPSIISVLIIFLNPNERAWSVMKVVSFVATASVNWVLWAKYAAMKSGPKDFYLMNGLTYLLYCISSIAGFYCLGYLVYSMTYANLRVFEMFGLKTFHSILVANGVMFLILICCERFSDFRFKNFLEWLRNNGNDKVEMDDNEDSNVIVQNNREVETLSLEEISRNMILEAKEAIEAKKQAIEQMPDSVWDESGFVKGRGEKVEHVEFYDIDRDITEGDFNASADAQHEFEENMNYSSDSLWGTHIYGDGQPITDYSDEENQFEELMRNLSESENEDDSDNASLWDKNIYKGRGEKVNYVDLDENDATDDQKIDYDSDALWESDFYQGRNNKSVPEKIDDFDDSQDSYLPENAIDFDSDNLWTGMYQGKKKKD